MDLETPGCNGSNGCSVIGLLLQGLVKPGNDHSHDCMAQDAAYTMTDHQRLFSRTKGRYPPFHGQERD